MQNSQHNRKRTPKSPRRARRGALMPAALLAVLIITILMSQFAQAQLRRASAARSEARAVQLAAIAADFDYYVHVNRGDIADDLTDLGLPGRELPTFDKDAFETDFLRVAAAKIPGFTLTYLVGHITDGGAANGDGSEVFGGLLLSAPDSNGASRAEMDTLGARLATYGAQGRALNLGSFVQNVLGRDLTGSERVILTAPLSGLDPKYVRRMRRAGHAAPKLVGSGVLDLGGHNLLNVGTLTATRVVARPDPQNAVDTPPSRGLRAGSLTTLHLNTKHLANGGMHRMLMWMLNTMPDAIRRLTGQCPLYSPGSASAPRNDQTHRSLRRPHPRRTRCGLSLFEAVLVMMIAVPMIQQGVRLAESYIRQQAGVQESRLLTQVVTAASTFALRDLNDQITTRGVGNIRVLDLEYLAGENAWVGAAARTSLGRDIQVIFYDTGLGKLVVLAHAFTPAGENHQPYMPRGGIGIGLVGTITADAPSMLRGPGLNYLLVGLQAQATTQGISHPPVVGDQLAIAVLRVGQDITPYLHWKEAFGPNGEKLNQMQTDLDMGGNNIIGAGEVQAEQVISNSIISEQAKVTDRLVAEEILVTGGSCTGCDQPPNTEGKTNP